MPNFARSHATCMHVFRFIWAVWFWHRKVKLCTHLNTHTGLLHTSPHKDTKHAETMIVSVLVL